MALTALMACSPAASAVARCGVGPGDSYAVLHRGGAAQTAHALLRAAGALRALPRPARAQAPLTSQVVAVLRLALVPQPQPFPRRLRKPRYLLDLRARLTNTRRQPEKRLHIAERLGQLH